MRGMIFHHIETRVLAGITMFLAMLILVGWVAINEPGRMAAFTERSLARSIERGGERFAATCSVCHGTDARGITGRAPGLDNPQLFGHDFGTGAIATQIGKYQDQKKYRSDLADLQSQLTTAVGSDVQTIRDQITALNAKIDPNAPQDLDAAIADLQSQYDALAAQMGPAIQRGYDPAHPDRLKNVNWAGDLHGFIYTTLIGGRPVSGSYWPQQMPTWGQEGGGPLRDDQVEDLVNYLLNFDKGDNWTIDDLNAVNQFAVQPVRPGAGGSEQAAFQPVGTDVAKVLDELQSVTGDATRGQALYESTTLSDGGTALGCGGCHEAGIIAPITAGTWTRIVNERLQDPALAGYTPEHYVVESILHPTAYVVQGFNPVMPETFGDQSLSLQNLADLLAFLQTQTQASSQ